MYLRRSLTLGVFQEKKRVRGKMKITLTGFVHGKQKETNKKTTNQAKKIKQRVQMRLAYAKSIKFSSFCYGFTLMVTLEAATTKCSLKNNFFSILIKLSYIFQGFGLSLSNTFLKEHLRIALPLAYIPYPF